MYPACAVKNPREGRCSPRIARDQNHASFRRTGRDISSGPDSAMLHARHHKPADKIGFRRSAMTKLLSPPRRAPQLLSGRQTAAAVAR